MEIVHGSALLVKTKDPHKITEVIRKSKIVNEQNGVYDTLIHWDLANAHLLKNLGFKKILSPIVEQYAWPGVYKPFAHQKETAAFLTLNRRAFCLNAMGCVDSETEYLSPTGWIKISEYVGGEVAQYHADTKSISFVQPEAYLKKPCADMVRIKTRAGVDQLLSPEHRVLLHSRSNPTKQEVISAHELLLRHDMAYEKQKVCKSKSRISFAEAAIPAVYSRTWGAGIPLSEAELRLQVAVIADGYISNEKTKHCIMRVKKQAKVDRLRKLLTTAEVQFVETTPEYKGAEGFHIFKFYAPLPVKHFDARFWQCSQNQIDAIYDEVLLWDGSFCTGNRYAHFHSTVKDSADFIQAVFNTKGHIARILEDKRENKYSEGICYDVVIRHNYKSSLQIIAHSTEKRTVYPEKSTDGFKYCFTVPTSFLLFRRNGCVFASGNTGKTSAVAWAADYLLTQNAIKRVLVVCPLSIMDCAWRKDLFNTVMHRKVAIAHGSREQRVKVIKGDAEFVIINYDGIETVRDDLAHGGFDLIVCDESTALKNAKTRRWKMLNSLIAPDTWLWLMTGTPAAQSPFDAYGQAKIVNPKSVPAYATAFKDQIMIKIGTFKWLPKHDAMDTVHQILQPAIRFTTEECLDLPEQLYTTYELEMSAQQKKYYEKLRKEMVIQAAGEEVTAVNAAVQMGKLLQISSGSVYSDTGEVLEFDCTEKLETL
jgi:hypothetical protein